MQQDEELLRSSMTFARRPRGRTRTTSHRDAVAFGENTCVEHCGSVRSCGIHQESFPGVSRRCEEWLQQERELWEAILWVPDLQCTWQVLLQCAGPRCHHLLRTLAPESSQDFAVRHDDGMFKSMRPSCMASQGGPNVAGRIGAPGGKRPQELSALLG